MSDIFAHINPEEEYAEMREEIAAKDQQIDSLTKEIDSLTKENNSRELKITRLTELLVANGIDPDAT